MLAWASGTGSRSGGVVVCEGSEGHLGGGVELAVVDASLELRGEV